MVGFIKWHFKADTSGDRYSPEREVRIVVLSSSSSSVAINNTNKFINFDKHRKFILFPVMKEKRM